MRSFFSRRVSYSRSLTPTENSLSSDEDSAAEEHASVVVNKLKSNQTRTETERSEMESLPRKKAGPQRGSASWAAAAQYCIKCYIGPGCLSLPLAFERCGVGVGLALLLLIFLLTVRSQSSLLVCKRALGHLPAPPSSCKFLPTPLPTALQASSLPDGARFCSLCSRLRSYPAGARPLGRRRRRRPDDRDCAGHLQHLLRLLRRQFARVLRVVVVVARGSRAVLLLLRDGLPAGLRGAVADPVGGGHRALRGRKF